MRQENALKEAAQRQLVILEGDEKRRTTYPGRGTLPPETGGEGTLPPKPGGWEVTMVGAGRVTMDLQ